MTPSALASTFAERISAALPTFRGVITVGVQRGHVESVKLVAAQANAPSAERWAEVQHELADWLRAQLSADWYGSLTYRHHAQPLVELKRTFAPGAQPEPASELLSRACVCAQLGISRWTLTRWITSGRFPAPTHAHSSGWCRWERSIVDTWLSQARRR